MGGDAVGGAYEFFAGAEISQPLYEDIVAGILFIDTGTVQTSPGFDRSPLMCRSSKLVPACRPGVCAYYHGVNTRPEQRGLVAAGPGCPREVPQ
jgi:hypothetical protein